MEHATSGLLYVLLRTSRPRLPSQVIFQNKTSTWSLCVLPRYRHCFRSVSSQRSLCQACKHTRGLNSQRSQRVGLRFPSLISTPLSVTSCMSLLLISGGVHPVNRRSGPKARSMHLLHSLHSCPCLRTARAVDACSGQPLWFCPRACIVRTSAHRPSSLCLPCWLFCCCWSIRPSCSPCRWSIHACHDIPHDTSGPRPTLHFNPTEVRGAIVTCGGLCPGLNSVIHHLVHTMLLTYKADKVKVKGWCGARCVIFWSP